MNALIKFFLEALARGLLALAEEQMTPEQLALKKAPRGWSHGGAAQAQVYKQ